MKNSRGITLASLVIMIASIILLSTMAIGFGYKYLTETKEADEKYFKEVLSSAVNERENNHNVNSSEYPRVGYHIKAIEAFKEIVDKYIPILRGSNSDLLYERGLWYIVDTEIAEKLGVKDSDNYIDLFDEKSEEEMTIALVDYYSGAVYIFDINGEEIVNIKDNLSGDVIEPNDGHVHDYNIPAATCTEDRKCLICGYVIEVALGHDYNGEMPAEPIDEEFHYKKECTRCHAKGGYERHQDLDGFAFYESGDGTWYHYNGCSICGWQSDTGGYEKCEIVWKSVSDTQHAKQCKICKHEERFDHILKYSYVDEIYHEQICEICGFTKIRFERHEDNDDDHLCDKCYAEIIITQNPILVDVKLKNKEYPNSHFVTDGETIQLIFTADKMITDAKVTICGYGGDNIRYYYSTDRLTCTAELFVSEDIRIAQNTEITFTIDCKSMTTGAWLVSPMTETTDTDSYLIYDSLPPTIEYILKEEY